MAASDPAMVIVTTVALGERARRMPGGLPRAVRHRTMRAMRSGSPRAVPHTTASPPERPRSPCTSSRSSAMTSLTSSAAPPPTEPDKLARCDWTPGPEGVPLLDACPDRFVRPPDRLARWRRRPPCVVLEPVDAEVGGAVPLAASARRHRHRPGSRPRRHVGPNPSARSASPRCARGAPGLFAVRPGVRLARWPGMQRIRGPPRHPGRRADAAVAGHRHCGRCGAWFIERRPDGATWQPATQQADVTVTGPARSLLLTLTRRLPLTDREATNINVDGDTDLAQHWLDSTAHVSD